MSPHEIVEALRTWTPFLAAGFGWNVIVSVAAMAIGTVLGAGLAVARLSHRRALVRASLAATALTRNIPTFVFLYYLAFVIPVEVQIGPEVYALPAWVKASLALAVAVVGFVSDNFTEALRHWRARNPAEALMFIPNWTSYFVVIVMASSTASVIGVDELVSRCNTVIAAVDNPDLMLWIYLYAMAWFFVCCFPLYLLMRQVKASMAHRLPKHEETAVATLAADA
ncbi:MAG TPA: ABC transporter permease subunit [Stellaceae bacterium]|nr:ABC transporter permease subunit [Stellaceae bacterium]